MRSFLPVTGWDHTPRQDVHERHLSKVIFISLMMAGYSEKDIDSTEEIWKPPTESEMKIIQARRDRSDRISKVMGTYLLKGYKMLASECDRCGTIELQDKMNKIYCVACEEVDPEIQKDSPALSERAASSQRAEQKFTSSTSSELLARMSSSSSVPIASSIPGVTTTTTTTTATTQLGAPHRSAPQPIPAGFSNDEYSRCLETVHKKLAWARMALETELDPVNVTSYLRVMTASAEALVTLKKLSTS